MLSTGHSDELRVLFPRGLVSLRTGVPLVSHTASALKRTTTNISYWYGWLILLEISISRRTWLGDQPRIAWDHNSYLRSKHFLIVKTAAKHSKQRRKFGTWWCHCGHQPMVQQKLAVLTRGFFFFTRNFMVVFARRSLSHAIIHACDKFINFGI